ncbi:hypothetical protein MTO96_041496 [Rhipicephalus appendiculatus]
MRSFSTQCLTATQDLEAGAPITKEPSSPFDAEQSFNAANDETMALRGCCSGTAAAPGVAPPVFQGKYCRTITEFRERTLCTPARNRSIVQSEISEGPCSRLTSLEIFLTLSVGHLRFQIGLAFQPGYTSSALDFRS